MIKKSWLVIGVLVLIGAGIYLGQINPTTVFLTEDEKMMGSWILIEYDGMDLDLYYNRDYGRPFTIIANMTFNEGHLVQLTYYTNESDTWTTTNALEWSIPAPGFILVIYNDGDTSLSEYEFRNFDNQLYIYDPDEDLSYLYERK